MKKLITKYWGLVLVVVLLSSLFVVGAPASADNYAWATSATVPTVISGVLAPAGFGASGVAQSGSTIYAMGRVATDSLYKSTDGGATWVAQATVVPTTNATTSWTLIAVAPDDPNTVVIVDSTQTVWVSVTGGSFFSALSTAAITTINTVSISPMTTARYIAVGGVTGGVGMVKTWTLGLVSPSWTDRALNASQSAANVWDVEFSPNFAADYGMIAISTNATSVLASVFSFNVLGWNTAGTYFPRQIIATADTLNKCDLVLDPNFYLGDLSLQVGFIGIADASVAASGGVYRLDATGTVSQIQGGALVPVQINSVAWDGTNLMSAPYVTVAGTALTIYRCANAVSALPTFVPSSTLKTPGTGTRPIVIFNGAVGYAFSQGQNAAVAKTTDLGKTFNAYRLINSNFTNILDFWISPDGTRTYAIVNDGVDVNLWARNAGVWARIMVLAGQASPNWLVRADADTPDTVFLGAKGATLMYKSTDGGVTWTIRGMAASIADFAVQDANTVFAVSNAAPSAGIVYKSTTGAFTWTPIAVPFLSLFGNNYSINLIATNSVLVGTAGGGVAYSNDGATFTTILAFAPADALTAGNTVVTATGTATGSTIFAGSAGGMLGKWTIGTSTSWGVAAGATYAVPITGIGYANGILYAINDTANVTYRFITPTFAVAPPFVSDTIPMGAATVTDQTNIVNSLVMSAGSNVLWARDAQATDDLISYTDPMIGAAAIPSPTYPTNNVIIPVNSLSGATNPFNFMWNVPSAPAPLAGYAFNVQVYLDEAGTIPYAGSTTAVLSPFSYTTGVAPATLGAGTAFVGTPGVTYYWRVRVASLNPQLGAWSAMQSFNVQQLQAIVPILSSPSNGASVSAAQGAAFSWNPIAGATSYSFELSTDATFATTIYKTTANAAGISVPSTVKLTAGTTYFWRVKVLTPAAGEWSTVANFTVAAPVTTAPPITIPPAVTPIVTVSIPPATTTIITIPPAENVTTEVNPSYIWAIIIIGAVLVIAVIVLIVRTRRSV